MRSAAILLLILAACAPDDPRPRPRPVCSALISAAIATPDGDAVTGMECIR